MGTSLMLMQIMACFQAKQRRHQTPESFKA